MKNKPNQDETPQYKIEHGIPVSVQHKYGRWTKLMESMNPGDSVVIPIGARNAIAVAAMRHGYKITTRTLGDGNMRVWLKE